MKFFIDTANVEEIREANSMGMADGVTTNPSLIATVPFNVLSKFASHPLTDKGLKAFLDDWNKAKK